MGTGAKPAPPAVSDLRSDPIVGMSDRTVLRGLVGRLNRIEAILLDMEREQERKEPPAVDSDKGGNAMAEPMIDALRRLESRSYEANRRLLVIEERLGITSPIAEESDARGEREDAHDDREPLERETEDRDEPGRNQPDAETDTPDLHG